MIRKIADSFRNVITGLGTARAHTSGQQIGGRRLLGFGELDSMQQKSFVRKVVYGIVDAAHTAPLITSEGHDPQTILDQLQALNAQGNLHAADRNAQLYGGGAVWMIFENDREMRDTAEPVDYAKSGKLIRLEPLDRWELTPTNAPNAPQILNTSPASPLFLTPELYLYTPQNGVAVSDVRKIHASRLIRFYGDPVPSRLRSNYMWWGAPALEGVITEVENVQFAQQGGANLLYEFGGKKLRIENLTDMLAAPDAINRLSTYLSTQQASFSMLRAWLVGPGYDVEPITANVSGWDAVHDRIAQQLAAASGQSVTYLYGQAPGGLSTDDEAGRKALAARVARHQEQQIIPAYEQLISTLLGSHGQDITIPYQVQIAPYEPATEEEDSERLDRTASAVALLMEIGVMSREDARATIRGGQFPGLVLTDPDEDAAGEGVEPTGAEDGDTVVKGESFEEPEEDEALPTLRDMLARRTDALNRALIPPADAAANARAALKVRKEKPRSQQGMTRVGLARANQLANRRPVSLATVERMAAYFERHEQDKKGATWATKGKGWQAWNGWGGDEGWAWAKRVLARQEQDKE